MLEKVGVVPHCKGKTERASCWNLNSLRQQEADFAIGRGLPRIWSPEMGPM